MDRLLNRESGLLGVSGISADMRHVQKSAQFGNSRAQLAIEMYVHRIRQAIAAMAASMAGLDVLAFTGGVGEHATKIRQAVCDQLGFLGVQLAPNRSATSQPDCEISDVTGQVRVFTIVDREDVMLAREACALLENLP